MEEDDKRVWKRVNITWQGKCPAANAGSENFGKKVQPQRTLYFSFEAGIFKQT